MIVLGNLNISSAHINKNLSFHTVIINVELNNSTSVASTLVSINILLSNDLGIFRAIHGIKKKKKYIKLHYEYIFIVHRR